jgi:hypothetical protein
LEAEPVKPWWQLQRDSEAAVIVESMRSRGLVLLRTFGKQTRWSLSSGASIPPAVAEAVVEHPNIVACGDGLFRDGPSQTFRHV